MHEAERDLCPRHNVAAVLRTDEKIGVSDITDEFVKLNKNETSEPDAKNVAIYRELQALQDELSCSLRGVFARHRSFVLNH